MRKTKKALVRSEDSCKTFIEVSTLNTKKNLEVFIAILQEHLALLIRNKSYPVFEVILNHPTLEALTDNLLFVY